MCQGLSPGDDPDERIDYKNIPLSCEVCNHCPYKGRPFVAYDGNFEAEFLFLGEAPGSEEILQSKPFIGASGKLLRKAIADNKIDSYCIDNTVPCGITKDFDYEAIIQCLENRLRYRNFNSIIALGKTAENALKILKLDKLHPRVYFLRHPAYPLYGGMSQKVWEDTFRRTIDDARRSYQETA